MLVTFVSKPKIQSKSNKVLVGFRAVVLSVHKDYKLTITTKSPTISHSTTAPNEVSSIGSEKLTTNSHNTPYRTEETESDSKQFASRSYSHKFTTKSSTLSQFFTTFKLSETTGKSSETITSPGTQTESPQINEDCRKLVSAEDLINPRKA